MTKSQDNQDQGITGDVTENTTPDIPTPDGTSELQANDVIGAHGRPPAVSSGSGTTYEGNNSAVSMEVDSIAKANKDE